MGFSIRQQEWIVFVTLLLKNMAFWKNGPIWVAVATNNNFMGWPCFQKHLLMSTLFPKQIWAVWCKIGEVSKNRHNRAIFVIEHHYTIKPVIISTKEHSKVLSGSESGALSVGSSCKVLWPIVATVERIFWDDVTCTLNSLPRQHAGKTSVALYLKMISLVHSTCLPSFMLLSQSARSKLNFTRSRWTISPRRVYGSTLLKLSF